MGEYDRVTGWFGWVVFWAGVNIGDFEVFQSLFHLAVEGVVRCDVACPIGVTAFAGCFEAIEDGDGTGVGQEDEVGVKVDFGIAEGVFVGVGDDDDFGAGAAIFCVGGVWFWGAEVFGETYLIVFCEGLIAKDK